MPVTSILELFDEQAARTPDAPVYTQISDDGRDVETLTYRQVHEAADRVARFLRVEQGLAPGDRALLVYPPSMDFVRAFVGCIRAGVVAVPLPPPNPLERQKDASAFSALASSAEAKVVLTNKRYARARTAGALKGLFDGRGALLRELPWITTDRLPPPDRSTPAWSPRTSDVAFLQYTSGSTSIPRGVMITHGNLIHQLSINAEDLGLGPSVRAVLWLPHFHDFALVSGILSALAGNGHLSLISPVAFVLRPRVWFDVMSRVRATHTAAPNFAFDLAVRKTTQAERASWDLSSLRVVMSAAEPIRPTTVDSFLDAFSASRLAPSAFCPAYGLAEHTVGVSVRGRARLRADRAALERGLVVAATDGSGGSIELVGCGAPSSGVRVRVVDPSTRRPVDDGVIGEIWVDSPSKAAGYFGRPADTAEIFRARADDPADPHEYLRTGDLGALHGGELFITGRLKDLIIVRGKNVHPHDVEETVRGAHPLVRPGGVVVFGAPAAASAGEALLIAVELRLKKLDVSDARAVAAAIHARVLAAHQLSADAIVLGQAGLVLKTTSGKLRRRACRDAYLDGSMLRAPALLHVERFAERSAVPAPASAEPGRESVVASQGAEPPSLARLLDVEPSLLGIIQQIASGFGQRARVRRGRATHAVGTVAIGWLDVDPDPRLPPHSLLGVRARHPILLRHANIKGFADDAVIDGRGASLRILPRAIGHADPNTPVLDVLLSTGERFFARDAATFHRWFSADLAGRARIIEERPEIAEIVQEILCDPSSYAELSYYSETVFELTSLDGIPHLVRYRLTPPAGPSGAGRIQRAELALPLDYVPRRAGDQRSPRYLQEDFARRLAGDGVHYLLEVQVILRPADPAALDAALDSTRTWPGAPWLRAGAVHLDALLDPEDPATAESLAFSPANAPRDLAMPLARSASDAASINHLRAVSYEVSARMRRGLPIDPRTLAPPPAEEPTDLATALERAASRVSEIAADPEALADPIAGVGEALRSSLARHPDVLERALEELGDLAERVLGAPESSDSSPPEGLLELTAHYTSALAGKTAQPMRDAADCHAPLTLRQGVWQGRAYARLLRSKELPAFLESAVGEALVDPRFSTRAVRALSDDEVLAIARYADLRPLDGRIDGTEFAATLVRSKEDGRFRFRAVVQTDQRSIPLAGGDDAEAAAARFLSEPVVPERARLDICRGIAGHVILTSYERSSPADTRTRVARSAAKKTLAPLRLGVVGAGATGLTLAYELEKRGHEITVFEQAGSVSGKCDSLVLDGRPYDLGGHICTRQYRNVWELARELGVEAIPATPFLIYDDTRREASPASEAIFERDAFARYRALRRETFADIGEPGLQRSARGLFEPLPRWIEGRGQRALAESFGTSYTSAGYGFLDDEELPALYFVKFAEMTGLLETRPAREVMGLWSIAGGFAALWRKMADALDDVRTRTRVESIRRSDAGVSVATSGGTVELDGVLLTELGPETLAILDATPEERDLLGRVRAMDYSTTVLRADGLPRHSFQLVKSACTSGAGRGRAVAFHHRHPGSDVYTVYAYGGSEEDLVADVERLGARVREVHHRRRFRFLPHVASEDVRAGFFDRLEALQGSRRTWYAGSLLAFELVECNVAYARSLVERFFSERASVSSSGSRAGVEAGVDARASKPANAGELRDWLVARVAAEIGREPSEVDPRASLETYALDSVATLSVIGDLGALIGARVSASIVLEHATLDAIANHLVEGDR